VKIVEKKSKEFPLSARAYKWLNKKLSETSGSKNPDSFTDSQGPKPKGSRAKRCPSPSRPWLPSNIALLRLGLHSTQAYMQSAQPPPACSAPGRSVQAPSRLPVILLFSWILPYMSVPILSLRQGGSQGSTVCEPRLPLRIPKGQNPRDQGVWGQEPATTLHPKVQADGTRQ